MKQTVKPLESDLNGATPAKRGIFIPIVAIVAVVGVLAGILVLRNRPVTLRGAVVRQSEDPNKEAPIEGVQIVASDGSVQITARSGPSGAFQMTLRRQLVRRHSLTLSFHAPGYQPYNIANATGNQLYVAKMVPLQTTQTIATDAAVVRVTNVSVRYTAKTPSTVDIGGGVKTFEVVNKGNVPCKGDQVCSPDGKWKAAAVTATLDAGPGNEFRNARVSCIAGPCPFTAIEHDGFSQGGRTISVKVLDWSDTTTFLLQAEAYRPVVSDLIKKSFPVIFDRTMNFSLPASAEGTCIEAEMDGTPIVFPIWPNLSLSFADCETQTDAENSRLFRCELKPGYAFR